MPSPYPTCRPPTFSPVPSQTISGRRGSYVTQPIEYEPWSSNTASQVVPAFLVRQTLPLPTATIAVGGEEARRSLDNVERSVTRSLDELERARREKLNETVLEPLMDMPADPNIPTLPDEIGDLLEQGRIVMFPRCPFDLPADDYVAITPAMTTRSPSLTASWSPSAVRMCSTLHRVESLS